MTMRVFVGICTPQISPPSLAFICMPIFVATDIRLFRRLTVSFKTICDGTALSKQRYFFNASYRSFRRLLRRHKTNSVLPVTSPSNARRYDSGRSLANSSLQIYEIHFFLAK